MQFTKRLLMGLGGVALVAMLASMFAPKSVHALVATLVEVSNTPSNPVPNADVSKSAAQNIELFCQDFSIGVNNPCSLQSQNGQQSAWSVPDGMNFVITDVDIAVQVFSGTAFVGTYADLLWIPPGGSIDSPRQEYWFLPTYSSTTQFHYSSGIVVLPGSALQFYCNVGSNVGVSATLHGYLTPN
jgi:hypothetical protein